MLDFRYAIAQSTNNPATVEPQGLPRDVAQLSTTANTTNICCSAARLRGSHLLASGSPRSMVPHNELDGPGFDKFVFRRAPYTVLQGGKQLWLVQAHN